MVLAAALGFVAVGTLLSPKSPDATRSALVASPTRPNVDSTGVCNIKGNISVSTGERIYHLPGQRYYEETAINTRKGERYFCSEAEARAAGWRRSKR